MGRAIHLFNTETEFNNKRTNDYSEPWVSLTLSANRVDYNKVKQKPLTFEILSDGEIGWKANDSNSVRVILYSKNGGEWTNITSTIAGTTISVVTGDVLRFKGDIWPGQISSTTYNQFTSTCTFAASGNPASLRYGEEIYGDEEITGFCFHRLFFGCSGMTTAPILPAMTLLGRCYEEMFYGCTSLTTAPELPATTLDNACYYGMFEGCTGLTKGPDILPATTWKGNCYYNMFKGCTSLTSSPALMLTTVQNSCYVSMFDGCTNLSEVKCFLTKILNSGGFSNWLRNVSATGTFYKTAGVTWPSGVSGIPSGWTVVEI